jgi:hypothetical protein
MRREGDQPMGRLAPVFPAVVVLSAVHELYLRNQAQLDRELSVLHPFWAAGLAATLAAALLRRAGAGPLVRLVLWAYYLGGFAFMLWGFLRALALADGLALWALDTAAGATAFVLAYGLAVAAAARLAPPRATEALAGVLALVLGLREAVLLGTRLERPSPSAARNVAAEVEVLPRADRPNVYHVLLDSFQDELFEAALPPGAAEALGGFVRFRATTPGRATVQVLPTILTGRDL